MCSFGWCQTRFEFLSQFRKVRNAFECFVTQVQTRLPKTKCVWPIKISVICTVSGRSLRFLFWPCLDRPLSGLSEGTHTRTGYAYAYRPSQFLIRLSTFQDVSSRMGETYIANFVFFPRANRSTNGLPRHETSCLLRSGFDNPNGSTVNCQAVPLWQKRK